MKSFPSVSVTIFACLILLSCEGTEEDETTHGFSSKARSIKNLQTFIVARKGVVEDTFYRSGTPTRLQPVNSVTKSITATLIGIAIEKQLIKSEHETIGQFLEPIVGPVEERVGSLTIAELLSLTAGAQDELADLNIYLQWRSVSNQLEYIIQNQLTEEKGTFAYNTGLTHILSAIITQVSGKTLSEFAEENLFTPLGITEHNWEMMERNINNGGAGLELSGPSMLKLGQLYLDKGAYNGKRIVSEAWIEKATSAHAATNTPFITPEYGYGWWLGSTSNYRFYMANGFGAQLIFIVPDLELIIVTTCDVNVSPDEAISEATKVLRLIYDEIVPYYTKQDQ